MGQVAAACKSGVIGRLESAMMQQARRNSNIWWRLEPSGELASKHPIICSGHAYFVFSLGRKIEEIQFECCRISNKPKQVLETSQSSVRRDKWEMLVLLVLLLLCHGLGNTHGSQDDHAGDGDMLSLLDFKRAINSDPNGALASWNTSNPLYRWAGITCGRAHRGRVITSLELAGQGLKGEITSSLGNLTSLRTLNLSINSFSGRLPPLGRLGKLEVLDLSWNSLRDAIPDGIVNCSRLRILDLSMNSLVGELHSKVGLLSDDLLVLNLYGNRLTGTIPPSLGNMTHLEQLDLGNNSLSGSIPRTLGNLQQLTVMDLSHNNLEGDIPSNLGDLGLLQHLDLSDNKIKGIIP
ncbi:receptor kinase-like protein Xa21 [Panicum virgatum]|uniref:receptor kinase-like protein Xa21 n=1 Tax=Panicum virgatum TaxID=38727 RepID=UPI0019D5F68B|nr:receptor kinase-like protein Xa21 [Panicum virgatum]